MYYKDSTYQRKDLDLHYDYRSKKRLTPPKSLYSPNNYLKHNYRSTNHLGKKQKGLPEYSPNQEGRLGSKGHLNHDRGNRYKYQRGQGEGERQKRMYRNDVRVRGQLEKEKSVDAIYRSRSQRESRGVPWEQRQFREAPISRRSQARINGRGCYENKVRSMSQCNLRANISEGSRNYRNQRYSTQEAEVIQRQPNHFNRKLRNTHTNEMKSATKTPYTQTPKTPMQPHDRGCRMGGNPRVWDYGDQDKPRPRKELGKSGIKYVSSVKSIKQKPFWFKSAGRWQRDGDDLKKRIRYLLNE